MKRKKCIWKTKGVLIMSCLIFTGMMLTSCAGSGKDSAGETNDASMHSEAGDSSLGSGAGENSMQSEMGESEEIPEDLEVMVLGETVQKEGFTKTEVFSTGIQDTFVIDVCLPEDYDDTKLYPVVYLTDCNWRRGDYDAITQLYESGETKEFILVGIGYPDHYDFDTIRVRDLINDPKSFLHFIINGIMPYVESTYAIDKNDRTFCGASYGGYFMLYSLFENDGMTKDLFKNYVLASPTFFESTDGLPLADYEDRFYRQSEEHELNVNLYLSVGGDESAGDFLRPIRSFVSRLEKREYEGLNLTYQEYEGMGHYDVWVPALLDGLSLYMKK